MKIYELRLTFGSEMFLYTRTFATYDAALKHFERIVKVNGSEIKTAKLYTCKANERGVFDLFDVKSL